MPCGQCAEVVWQAVNWTGSKFVGGLSSIDVALEGADVLKKLEPEAPPGTEGGMTRDCNMVRPAPFRIQA